MELPSEKELPLGPWTITREAVQQYLKGTGDTLSIYQEADLAPPLALAAYTLGALLEKLTLPPGTIHSLQGLETWRPIHLGEEITAAAHLERPKIRAGMQFITISYTLSDSFGQTVLTGKSTVLVTREKTDIAAGE